MSRSRRQHVTGEQRSRGSATRKGSQSKQRPSSSRVWPALHGAWNKDPIAPRSEGGRLCTPGS